MAESRSKKMYKNSPRIESDGDGKKVIKRGPSDAGKKSAETSGGINDSAADGEHGPMYERHIKEVGDMNDRHVAERKDMVKRHMKEMKNAQPMTDGEPDMEAPGMDNEE